MINSMIQQAYHYFSAQPLWLKNIYSFCSHYNNDKTISLFAEIDTILLIILIILCVFSKNQNIPISAFLIMVIFNIICVVIYSMNIYISCVIKPQNFSNINNNTNLTYQIYGNDADFFCQSGNHYYYVGTINQNHSQIIANNHDMKNPTNGNKAINISPQFKELTQAVNKPQVRKYFRVNDDSKNVLSVKNGQLILTNVSKTQGKNARLILNDTSQKVQSSFKTHTTKQKVTKNSTLYIAQ